MGCLGSGGSSGSKTWATLAGVEPDPRREGRQYGEEGDEAGTDAVAGAREPVTGGQRRARGRSGLTWAAMRIGRPSGARRRSGVKLD